MLTLEERLDNIDAGVVSIYHQLDEVATFDELDAVVQQIFDDIEDLENRINAIRYNLDIVESTLSEEQSATRK